MNQLGPPKWETQMEVLAPFSVITECFGTLKRSRHDCFPLYKGGWSLAHASQHCPNNNMKWPHSHLVYQVFFKNPLLHTLERQRERQRNNRQTSHPLIPPTNVQSSPWLGPKPGGGVPSQLHPVCDRNPIITWDICCLPGSALQGS